MMRAWCKSSDVTCGVSTLKGGGDGGQEGDGGPNPTNPREKAADDSEA